MVQSVERALDILEALAGADEMVSLSQLHAQLDLPFGTLHRLLSTLIECGYAAQDADSQRYGPGPKLLEVATRAESNSRFSLSRIAKPFMQTLTEFTGETTNLVTPRNGEAVYVSQVTGEQLMRMFTVVGQHSPLYCTGAGKSILAGLPDQRIHDYLATTHLATWTPNTITTPEALWAELQAIRARGFSVDDEEHEIGARCVAAPIFNREGVCVAAISVSSPTPRLSRACAFELGPRVRAAADGCSAELGFVSAAPIHAGQSLSDQPALHCEPNGNH